VSFERRFIQGGSILDEVIRLAPGNPIGYLQKGRLLFVQKKEKEAVTQFNKALSLDPNSFDALKHIVAIHLQKKDTQKALEKTKAQVSAAPKNPLFHNLAGTLYEANRQPDEAEESLKKP